MPVAKLSTIGSFNGMESVMRQSVGKEPLLPLSRTTDNPVQWMQFFHALDQPDLLGWPLTSPIKVQMQKCEKCSQEFYSSINYRRHIRVHRRSLNLNKEFHKNRDLLAAFWDKLSLEEAKEVVSFNGVMLKEFAGSSLIKGLASSLSKPGIWTLPQVFVSAGSSLLDIIQAKPSGLPISSQELFGILDATSERTFLCAGAPESVQKYLFDGEASKACLELKNLVACISFLFEQQLVKAWVADKDAESLICQKLLVEEEEAAKERLAELLERKKQKKLRQKEHKMKEQFHRCKRDLNVADDTTDRPVLAEAFGPSSPSDSSSNSTDGHSNLDSCSESRWFQRPNLEKDIEVSIDFSSECISQEDSQTTENQVVVEYNYQHLTTNNRPVLNSQKMGPTNDRAVVNGSQVWPKKDEADSHVKCLKPSLRHQMKENNCEVIIGSISIPVNSCDTNAVGSKVCEGFTSLSMYKDLNGNGLQVPYTSIDAKEFLAQRWKEAISQDHVQLALS